MAEARDTLAKIRDLADVRGAVIWRIGDAPAGDMGPGTGAETPGLLSAGIGSLEHVVETVGLGQIEEVWFLTDAGQCMAIRLGLWQCVVVVDRSADVMPLRDAITAVLEGAD